uniref:Uncharacterized protein n=1 Tax=Sphaerodactylus townsendi TaxID=933632 RepID=A0ACB8GA56_9SAUR
MCRSAEETASKHGQSTFSIRLYNVVLGQKVLDVEEEEEDLLDAYVTPSKGSQKRAITTPENPRSKRTVSTRSPHLLFSPTSFSPRNELPSPKPHGHQLFAEPPYFMFKDVQEVHCQEKNLLPSCVSNEFIRQFVLFQLVQYAEFHHYREKQSILKANY